MANEPVKVLGSGELAQREVYEHHEEYAEPNIHQETIVSGAGAAPRVEVDHGASASRCLVMDAQFTLCDHDLGRLDGEHAVMRLKHEGHAPQAATAGDPVYADEFEYVVATITARPSRSIQQVTETARAVGPAGQEICTDNCWWPPGSADF